MKAKNKQLGATLIIAGTSIGGGMLALPIASAAGGFLQSIFWLGLLWFFMSFVALYTVEANSYYREGLSVAAMAEKALGRWAKWLTSGAILLLFYALLSAYIAGGSSLLKAFIPVSWFKWIPLDGVTLVYTLALGAFIYACTTAVDYLNRFLFLTKLIIFVLLVLALLPQTKAEHLFCIESHTSLFWIAPLLFTSFGFHGSLPALFGYVGSKKSKSLAYAIWLGGLFPLAFYIVWEAVSLGTLPLLGPVSFASVASEGGDVGSFLSQLNSMVPQANIHILTNGFTLLAIITSFLGVALGLFDFIAESLCIPKHAWGRMLTTLLTFCFPLGFAVLYPQGFIKALGLAAIALSIIAVIMPTLIVYKIRQAKDYKATVRTPGGNLVLLLCLLAGVVIIALELWG